MRSAFQASVTPKERVSTSLELIYSKMLKLRGNTYVYSSKSKLSTNGQFWVPDQRTKALRFSADPQTRPTLLLQTMLNSIQRPIKQSYNEPKSPNKKQQTPKLGNEAL